MVHVIDTYPPSEYPKLYPQTEHEDQNIHTYLCSCIFLGPCNLGYVWSKKRILPKPVMTIIIILKPCKTVVYTSMGTSFYLMVDVAVEEYKVDYLDPLIMSLYFQLLAVFGIGALLRSSDLKQ